MLGVVAGVGEQHAEPVTPTRRGDRATHRRVVGLGPTLDGQRQAQVRRHVGDGGELGESPLFPAGPEKGKAGKGGITDFSGDEFMRRARL
jgi:hypothetical protein